MKQHYIYLILSIFIYSCTTKTNTTAAQNKTAIQSKSTTNNPIQTQQEYWDFITDRVDIPLRKQETIKKITFKYYKRQTYFIDNNKWKGETHRARRLKWTRDYNNAIKKVLKKQYKMYRIAHQEYENVVNK